MSRRLAQDSVGDELHYLYTSDNLPALEDVEPLRWRTLIGSDAEKIGTIEHIEIDEGSGRVEFLHVSHGGFLGFGAERFLVPVTAITEIDDKSVHIDRTVEALNGVPPYEFDRVDDPDYYMGIRRWWSGGEATIQRPPD